MQESLPLLLDANSGGGAKIARASVIDMPTALGNINDLSQSLTIGGTAYAPCAYLVADDINPTTGAWASRHDTSKVLSLAGTGAAPTYAQSSAISNSAVMYNNAKYHTAADTTWGQITTGDGVLEILLFHPGSATSYILNSCISGQTRGFRFYISAGTLVLLFGDGTNFINIAASAALTTNAIIHFMGFIDRSEKAYFYTNGVYFGVSASTAAIGNSVGGSLAVGALSGGATLGDPSILQAAVWDLTTNPFPGAATNQAVMGAIAAERFAKVAGIYDRKATTYSFARTTAAYLDRYVSASVRQLFHVSVNWPRICDRADSTATRATGYLSEIQRTNELIYSEDFSQAATWVPTRCAVGSNVAVAPDGNTTADSIIADSAPNTHYVSQAIGSATTDHIFSVFAKSGNKTWIKMETTNPPNAWAFFDLGNGVVGDKGTGVDNYGIASYGNGWYRCWMNYVGGVPSHSHVLSPADDNNDNTFAGDATTANIYVWGAQHEEDGIVLPTSYIKTVAAAVTRTKDALTRAISVASGKISTACNVFFGHTHDASMVKTVVSVDDATANNFVSHDVSVADVAVLNVTTGGSAVAAVTGTTNIDDGNWHALVGKSKANYAAQTVDGTPDGTPDTALTMAASYTVARIGCSGTGLTQQPTGLISKIKVFKDVL